ncbi:hypothetical protein MF271_09710 [Deinococcus sp. KNUC1210]|uniref:hypothetical protein n=1 Tax=Deinococcus sp. KNUC1210 TaxID=2917691 RepID=UPI001EF033B3|nr:hypothetical protein [Deinococcus sp. KNUC1210]ULH16816.1 hypothetical protein MF271_09710 [Deinococcus sp. KNUC1210]
MTSIRKTVQGRFPEVILGFSVLGFGFLLAELIGYEHYEKGSQIIGFVSTIVGLLLSLLGFMRGSGLRRAVLGLLALLTLVGLFGLKEHNDTRTEDAAKFAQRQSQAKAAGTSTAASTQDGPPGEGGKFRSDIPVLAPLSLSGLAALSFLAILARRQEGQPEEVRAVGVRA